LALPDLNDTNEIIFGFSHGQGVPADEPRTASPDRFTEALVAAIEKPGLPVTEVFSTVQRQVSVASGGKQVPFFLAKATAEFNFLAPLPPPPPTVTVREPGKDELRPNRTDRQEYVWIPPGSFQMGCVPTDKKCQPQEQPRHAVTITQGFWLGRTEVEINAYQRYVEVDKKGRKMPESPNWDRKWNASNHPITSVSWLEAKNYCEWAGGRLPTEAEWEYAARAGSSDEIYPLNDENSRDKANFSGKKQNDRFEYTAPVRSFDANKFGLFDLAGNVWEWTQDWYDADYYKSSPAKDPTGPTAGKEHSVRGGSWDSDPREHLRLSYRQGYGKGGNIVGFRCALEDTPAVRKLLF
jgi:formylglycine-generating enzyme required for sulfatase activity